MLCLSDAPEIGLAGGGSAEYWVSSAAQLGTAQDNGIKGVLARGRHSKVPLVDTGLHDTTALHAGGTRYWARIHCQAWLSESGKHTQVNPSS